MVQEGFSIHKPKKETSNNHGMSKLLQMSRNAAFAFAVTLAPSQSTTEAFATPLTKASSLKGIDSITCEKDRTPLYGTERANKFTKTRLEFTPHVFKEIKNILENERNKGLLKGVGTLIYDFFLALDDLASDTGKLKDIFMKNPDVFKDTGVHFNILLSDTTADDASKAFDNSRYALQSKNGGNEMSTTGLYSPHTCTMSWDRTGVLGWTKDTLGIDQQGRAQKEGVIIPIEVGLITSPNKDGFAIGAKFLMDKHINTQNIFLYTTIDDIETPLIYQLHTAYNNRKKSAAVMKPLEGQQFGED